jgi:hypothetical protein
MSHFYGGIRGDRGEATRRGRKSSGYRAYAASWQGAIEVHLGHNEQTGRDTYSVYMRRHGSSQGWEGYIVEGNLGEHPELPALLPTPTIESFSDEALVAEVKRRFGIEIGLRQPNPPEVA